MLDLGRKIGITCLSVLPLISGCVWVSHDRYFSNTGSTGGWNCGHLMSAENCRYVTSDFDVSVELGDRSNHATWFGIWPVPFLPVWFATDTKQRDFDGKLSMSITWHARGAKSLVHDARKIGIRLGDAGIMYPAIARNSRYQVGKAASTMDISEPMTTSGSGYAAYAYDSISYTVDSRPERFTLYIGTVEIDSQKFELPSLELVLEDGYHYDESSL